jgi:hypothetical protein
MAQTLFTGLIVACCAAYVAWSLLLPAAARRRIALALLRWRWPAGLATRLRAQAKAASGCHCDGCERGAAPAAPPDVRAMHWAPRRRN